MKKILLIFACSLVFVSAAVGQKTAQVTGESIDLGGRSVFVPAPEGFTNGLGRSERFTTVMTATESPDLDILAAHIPISKIEGLTEGPAALDLYTKVSILKKGRSFDVTPEVFAQLMVTVEKNFNTYLDPNGATIKRTIASANTKLKEQTGEDPGIDLGQPTNLGFFDKHAKIFSTMVMTNMAVNGQHKMILISVSYLLANRRLIYVYCFKRLSSEGDVKTLQDFTKKWTAAIIAANK